MKYLVAAILTGLFAASSLADIQAPPISDQGPTRKLGRGLSNVLFGWTEIPEAITTVNKYEGNAAAASYGVVRGFGRAFARFGSGIYEVFTFPFPTQKGTYKMPYPDRVPHTFRGYTEFPPEVGFETRYYYINQP